MTKINDEHWHQIFLFKKIFFGTQVWHLIHIKKFLQQFFLL